MLANSYIEVSGGGYSIIDMANALVDDIFNKLNEIVPFNRIYKNLVKYNGNTTICTEKYELINRKILVFKVEIGGNFCLGSVSFNVKQCICDNTDDNEAILSTICNMDHTTIGYFSSYRVDTSTYYYSISSCILPYTILNNENCNLFYMRSPINTFTGLAGTYKIDDKIFCITKSGVSSNESIVIWNEDNNKYFIAPLIFNGITIDKEDSFITMPVFLANNNNINKSSPTTIFTDYVFKDWLLADSYHCLPNTKYTINGNDYYCHHSNEICGKYSLLIKI